MSLGEAKNFPENFFANFPPLFLPQKFFQKNFFQGLFIRLTTEKKYAIIFTVFKKRSSAVRKL